MVVEDDQSLAEWIADYLSSHDYLVTLANRGDEALDLIASDSPDLIVLDLNLPVLDGLEVCRQARAFHAGPILMLTARDSEDDEIRGLDTGADDYLGKPVQPHLLLARIRALLRRSSGDTPTGLLTFGALKINPDSRTVLLDGDHIALSTNEFDVLSLLASHADRPLSRDVLISTIRGIEYDGFDRSVDVCISRLRRKLGDDAQTPRRIKTLRGTGYLFAADAW